MKKLIFFWQQLLSTFWFVPVLIIAGAIALALILLNVDSYVEIPKDGLAAYLFVNSAESARAVLSTISSAMIGVAGTVFSVTLVALTLASSQYGPRLIRNFMYVRINQVVLGSYIASYIYCLLILNGIHAYGGYHFIPSLSILMAILSALCNIILLIVFIHHIASSIQVDKMISDISNFLTEETDNIFPVHIGNEPPADNQEFLEKVKSGYQTVMPLKSPSSGYLQYMDGISLMSIAKKHHGMIEFDHKPGDYLVKNIEVGRFYLNESISDEKIEEVQDQLVIGNVRTIGQDFTFYVHQLVEIASRAISPGINDPYTAISCIDSLSATLSKLAQVGFPASQRFDENDQLRLAVATLNFEGVLDTAFNQIRQFAPGSTVVIIRLMEALTRINQFVKNDRQRLALMKHADMILKVGESSIPEKHDLEDLKAVYEKLRKGERWILSQ